MKRLVDFPLLSLWIRLHDIFLHLAFKIKVSSWSPGLYQNFFEIFNLAEIFQFKGIVQRILRGGLYQAEIICTVTVNWGPARLNF
jgi:hypothetical protein